MARRHDGVQWFRPRGNGPQPRTEDLPPGQRQVQFPSAQRGVRDAIAGRFKPVGDLPAYRVVLDRGGLSSPAETVVAGPEEAVLRALQRFRDAGATDLVVSVASPPGERQRTPDLLAQAARDA